MDFITFGLDITENASNLTQQILKSNDELFIKTSINRIVQNFENYDDFCLAGRLLLRNIVKSIPSVEVYVSLNKNLLADHIMEYMLANAGHLDHEVTAAERYNYVNQDYFSASTMIRSYLLKAIIDKDPTETPVLHNLRIAVQLYHTVSLTRVLKAFHEMNEGYYTHASPTKYNAGTKRPQMASCFLMEVDDDLSSMMYTGIGDLAMISSSNGGIGIGLNNIRHSDIAGTGDSVGVVPYARVCDKAIGYVDQSRKRRGAATGFLSVWHIDVMEFAQAASTYIPQDLRLIDLTPCIWMHDLFFERVRSSQKWTLFCPNTAKGLVGKYGQDFETEYLKYEALSPVREQEYAEANKAYDALRLKVAELHKVAPMDGDLTTGQDLLIEFKKASDRLIKAKKARIVHRSVDAREILTLIADIQLKSGKPYVMNGDRCNVKSNQMNIGPINNSNLCVEIVQYCDSSTFSSCNLASINLPRYVLNRYSRELIARSVQLTDEEIMTELKNNFDFSLMGNITKSVVYNINKVIEYNYYPLEPSKIEDFNLKTRPLGIGVSGLDDAFKALDLVYGSRESRILNKMIFACMYYNGLEESVNLAIEHEPYPLFKTGTCKVYDPHTKNMREISGSPLSNGLLQFDLWQLESQRDEDLGRNNDKVYDPKDNIPIDPKFFGVETSWENLTGRIMKYGVRNSLILAVMPTASTAQVMRNAESIEAHQSNMYVREVLGGSFTIINRHLIKDLKEIDLLDKETMRFLYNSEGKMDDFVAYVKERCSKTTPTSPEVLSRAEYLVQKYRTMFDIKPSVILSMARQRGIYICQSQSTNLYMRDPTITDLAGVQMYGYYNKLKTHVYYTRKSVDTANTGFNKKVADAKVFDASVTGSSSGSDSAGSPTENQTTPLACSIENEGCEMCGA